MAAATRRPAIVTVPVDMPGLAVPAEAEADWEWLVVPAARAG